MPFESVTTVRTSPVAVCVDRVTVAPGAPPRYSSVTRPLSSAVASCAQAGVVGTRPGSRKTNRMMNQGLVAPLMLAASLFSFLRLCPARRCGCENCEDMRGDSQEIFNRAWLRRVCRVKPRPLITRAMFWLSIQ